MAKQQVRGKMITIEELKQRKACQGYQEEFEKRFGQKARAQTVVRRILDNKTDFLKTHLGWLACRRHPEINRYFLWRALLVVSKRYRKFAPFLREFERAPNMSGASLEDLYRRLSDTISDYSEQFKRHCVERASLFTNLRDILWYQLYGPHHQNRPFYCLRAILLKEPEPLAKLERLSEVCGDWLIYGGDSAGKFLPINRGKDEHTTKRVVQRRTVGVQSGDRAGRATD